MGNINSCQNLTPGPNRICDIGGCTKSVVGLSSNSSSPTDVWILTLQPGTKYGNLQVTGEVVLKIFISNSNIPVIKESPEIVYESSIYEYIVQSMFAYYINPHFIPYYGRAINCNVDQLVNIIRSNNTQINEDNIYAAIYYNTIYYGFKERKKNRSSVTDLLTKLPDLTSNEMTLLIDNSDNFGYGMIATAKANGNTFKDFFKSNKVTFTNQTDGSSFLFPSEDNMLVIIQIVSALCALEGFECAHNDLHGGNIFVNTKPPTELPFVYTYTSEGTTYMYKLNTDKNASIYDWDRSYCPLLGDNDKNTDIRCNIGMNCNEFIPGRDILKILTYIIMYMGKTGYFVEKLLDIIWSTAKRKEWFRRTVLLKKGNNPYFLHKTPNQTMERSDFNGMRKPYEILTKLLSLCTEFYPYSVKILPNDPIIYQQNIVYNFDIQYVINSKNELQQQLQQQQIQQQQIQQQQIQQQQIQQQHLQQIYENDKERMSTCNTTSPLVKQESNSKHNMKPVNTDDIMKDVGQINSNMFPSDVSTENI